MFTQFYHFRCDSEISISYLPLSHVAAQLFDVFIATMIGTTVHFAQPDALKVCIRKNVTLRI